MKKVSDLTILETIQNMTECDFDARSLHPEADSQDKVYIPVDIELLAEKLSMNKHLLWGRLYYHLDHKYKYSSESGALTHLFAPQVGKERNCVNFPYLCAIVAEKQGDANRYMAPLMISLCSLVFAILAFVLRH